MPNLFFQFSATDLFSLNEDDVDRNCRIRGEVPKSQWWKKQIRLAPDSPFSAHVICKQKFLAAGAFTQNSLIPKEACEE